ncbi:MAG TPA: phosphotransferase [Micromonosporaceae bacterium]|nr:phosphotransferase [Micromonosporaceae bacterium]
MLDDDAIRDLLATAWRRAGASVEPHHGGMNSATWWVGHGGRRYVAKHVPTDQSSGLAGGVTVALLVQAAGIPSGAPVPTPDGRLAVDTADGPVVLLRFVPGTGPLLDVAGRRLIGDTLGRVHVALTGQRIDGARDMFRPDPDGPHIEGCPTWVRPGIQRALADYDALDPATLTHGMLHTDPAPDAFLVDPDTGEVGLIDWPTACHGPLLYDVASAVMYLGGPRTAAPMLNAYLATGALDEHEMRRGLDVLRRYRWAVQAWYFAHRIAVADMTGIDDPAENLRGLEDARVHLAV